MRPARTHWSPAGIAGRLGCSPLLAIGGIVDPIYGLLIKILGIFWPTRVPRLADTPRRRRRGLTLVLGGIEGPSIYNLWMVWGILRSGYRGSVVRFDWNAGVPFWRSLVNLASRSHHRRQTQRIVEFIRAYDAEHPGSPVNLVAQSGGCWIVLRVLGRLPEAVNVNTAVLIAPSISPGRNVGLAAARCASGLVSVRSAGDFFFLGVGTVLLGTSDRVHVPSAGFVGWRRRPDRLVDVRWRPEWIRLGYIGNHTTSTAPGFIRAVIGPLLVGSACSRSGLGSGTADAIGGFVEMDDP